MSRNYSIWHEVQACCYKSNKSYGGKTDSGETIYVGTSSKNSHEHCKILTTKREITHPKYGDCYSFKTSIDNVVLKETLVSIKDRKVVEVITVINHIKSLI